MTLSIPKLSDQELADRLKRIKPVLQDQDGLYYIKPVDPSKVAFTWDPKPTKDALDLEPLCTIRTLHGYGYHGFFKPTIAEVLAQIPLDKLAETVAFRVQGPETVSEMNQEKEALNAGFHVSQTVLYKRSVQPTFGDKVKQGLQKFGLISSPPPPNPDLSDPKFAATVKLGMEKLGLEKMVEICGTHIHLNKWAAGTSQPMRRTRRQLSEDIAWALEDLKSDPTIEPGKVVLDKLRSSFYIVKTASSFEHQKLWEEVFGYPHGRYLNQWSFRQGDGWIQPIGQVGEHIVEINLHWDTINGREICYIRPESRVVDNFMIGKWVEKYRGKIPSVNSMNYHQVIHAIQDAMENKK